MTFLSHLINGISLGSVYAIIALGYTMVYGIAKMLNFAHGDVIMVGAYISFCTTSYLGLSPLVSVLLSILVCTLLGIAVERLAYKPLRQAPSLAVLITAIGVSYFLQNAALLIWGSSPKTFSSVVGNWSVKLFDGQLVISGVTIVTIIACTSIVITAVYILRVVGKILYGTCTNEAHLRLSDATWDERLSVVCLVVAIAGMGLAPLWVSDMIRGSVAEIIAHILS